MDKKQLFAYLAKLKSWLIYAGRFAIYLGKLIYWGTKKFVTKYPRYAALIAAVILLIIISRLWGANIVRFITAPRPLPVATAPKDSGFQFVAKDNRTSFSALIGQTSGNAPKVQTTFRGGVSADFVLTDLNPTIAKPTKSGNKITFKDVRTNVDISYQTLTNGIKEDIIVKKPTQGNAFTFTINNFGAAPKEIAPDTYSPIFYDTHGSYVFHFAKPFAVDAKGARTDNVLLNIHKADTETSYKATVVVNEKWLSDPARAYPITIDPTVVYDNTSSPFSSGQFNRVSDVTDAIKFVSQNVSGPPWYTYERIAGGQGTQVTSGDKLEYDVYVASNVIQIGGIDIAYTDGTNARDLDPYIDQNGIDCAGNESTADLTLYLNTWIHRSCTIPNDTGHNPVTKTINYLNLVNENDSNSTNTIYYANITVKNSSGAILAKLYESGPVSLSTASPNSNAGNVYSVSVEKVQVPNAPSLTTNYQELAADQNTVGLWHMNEASGNVLDSSGNSNTGTPTNTTVVSGILNNTRSFNGTNSYISVTDSNSIDTPGKAITIEAWVYPRTDCVAPGGGSQTIAEKEQAYYLNLTTTCTPQFYWYGLSTPGYHVANTALPLNQWSHVAATYDGAGVGLYINGVLDKYVSGITGTGTINANALGIGANVVAAIRYFDGYIDEVRISSVSRSPEEIRMDAQRRPYSVYTSEVIDLTTVTAWNNLTWTELGVSTGDGETLSNATGLVAQWNFNNTSGTTASNNAGAATCGGTGTNCDFTLNNFASTGSQDAAAGTGWTADNKRWGAGALMLSTVATADFLSRTDPTGNVLDPNSSDFSVETWIKTSDTAGGEVISNNNANGAACTNNGWRWGITAATGIPVFRFDDNGATAGCDVVITSAKSITDGQWHLVTTTVTRGGTAVMYIDGVPVGSDTVDSYTNITVAGSLYMGGSTGVLNAVVDSTRFYTRTLSPSEVAANYNAGNVEFQTRVGASTDPNDGTWEAWKPTTSEAAVESFDSNINSDNFTNLLLHGNGVDASTTFVDNSKMYSSHNFTVSGDAQIDTAQSKFGGSSMLFDGTGDYISTPDSEDWNFSNGDFTIDFWVRFNALPALGGGVNVAQNIISQTDSTPNGWAVMLWVWSGDNTHYRLNFHSKDGATNSIDKYWDTVAVNTWYHVTLVRSSGVMNMFVNGTSIGSGAFTYTIPNIANNLWIGSRQNQTYVTSTPFNGWLDELRITKGLARWTSNFTAPSSAYENPTAFITSTDTVTKIEGSGSEKIQTGQLPLDINTVGLWHLDEAGGSGAYIKDASSSASHGTPTGTTVVNGITGKARSFNGTTDYISAPAPPIPSTSSWTYEMWVKLNTVVDGKYILDRTTATNNLISLTIGSTGKLCIQTRYDDGTGLATTCTTTAVAGQWYHVAMVRNYDSSFQMYVNGALVSTTTDTGSKALTAPTPKIGLHASTANGLDGTLDEFRISNIAHSADAIAESYRMGRDHYINRTLTSADLSAKQKLAFNIAADRPGTYLSATIGNNAFANYQPDANTVGLWHLDEQGGGAYVFTDNSGNGNHGYVVNTGTGKDGNCTVASGTTNLNTASCAGRATADAVNFSVTANTAAASTSITVSTTPTGLAVNDEILIINLQGTGASNADVGKFETKKITAIATNTLTLDSPLVNGYDGTTQKIMVQRVPHYQNVTVASGATLTVNAWDGAKSGVLNFRATGTVVVIGSISANSLGYRGGAGGTTGGGTNGESYDGSVGSGGDDTISGSGGGNAGTSGGGSSSNNITVSASGTRGGGGGGGNQDAVAAYDGAGGGGGGGHGYGGGGGGGAADDGAGTLSGGAGGAAGTTSANAGGGGGGGDAGTNLSASGGAGGDAGSAGAIGNVNTGTGGPGGAAGSGATTGQGGGAGASATSTGQGAGGAGGGGSYGTSALSTLYFGSGGGGGGGHDSGPASGQTGGIAGGIIYISTNSLSVSGSITANGASGVASSTNGGASGGGAGGSVRIESNDATLGSSLVTASGGSVSATTGNGGGGGAGGSGRIAVVYHNSISGSTTPTSTNTQFIINSAMGNIGKARSFNGTSDYITIPNSSINLANGSFTVSAWAKQGATGINNFILTQGLNATANNLLGFGFRNTNVFTCFFYSNDLDTTTTYADTANWHHWACTYDTSNNLRRIYRDGVLVASGTSGGDYTGSGTIYIGKYYTSTYYNGAIDEVRIDNTARSPADIRAAYEYGKRTHPVTIDFGAKLDSGNLIASCASTSSCSDTSFTVDGTYYGLNSKGSALYPEDKIIVRENYNGTTYIAQGTVNGVDAASGAVTVASWDSGSTFPDQGSSVYGYTVNADVFKWQREYFDVTGSLSTQRNAVTQLTLRATNGNEGRTIWLDDLKSTGSYLTTPSESTITSSTGSRYLQYRIIQSLNDYNVNTSVTSASINFTATTPDPPPIGTPTVLSSSSIRWNFSVPGVGSNPAIIGFKVYDTGNTLKQTCVGAAITLCDETGLTPNTSYTRKVVAYNTNGNSIYSQTATAVTLAALPDLTLTNATASTVDITASMGSNPSDTEIAIYQQTGTSCTGSGGNYLADDGTSNGSTALWQTASAWGTGGTISMTGLALDTTQILYCVKARNRMRVETAFGGNNTGGGFTPISGHFTMNTSMTMKNKYLDGVNATGKFVAAGATTNTLAYSSDGITWTGLGTGIFSLGRGVSSNKTRWVAAGQGTNTLAYSSDGITWTGLGTSTFSTTGYRVAWNGIRWVAAGQGTNTLAYSSDGITWTGLGTSTFSNFARDVAWSGTRWVAVGIGTNTLAYSNDGITWTGLGSSIMAQGNAVAWNGTRWVAGGIASGTNSLAYSSDGITWTGLGSNIFSAGQDIKWNGTRWVAAGASTNTLAYSADGIVWTGLGSNIFSTGEAVAWNGTRWVGLGEGTTNTIAYSSEGITWTGLGKSTFTSDGRGVAWKGPYYIGGLDLGAVGLWTMDESPATANLLDTSGYDFSGVPVTNGTSVQTGKYGNARRFNGTSDYITVTENNALDPSAITLEAWVRPSDVTQDRVIINKGDDSGYQLVIGPNTNQQIGGGILTFKDRGVTNTVTSREETPLVSTPATWYHIAATGDSCALKIYINGVQNATNNSGDNPKTQACEGTAAPYGVPNTSANVLIGKLSTNQQYYSGDIDDVHIYPAALDAFQIKNDMNNAGNHQNISKFTLNSGTLTLLPDESISAGSFVFPNGSAASIATPIDHSAELKPNTPIWFADTDGDGAAGTTKMYHGSKPTGGKRRGLYTGGVQGTTNNLDCNDGSADVWIPHAQCHADADGDTYTNGLQANSACINTVSCATATKASAFSDGAAASTYTAGRLLNSASSPLDCDDTLAAIGTGKVFGLTCAPTGAGSGNDGDVTFSSGANINTYIKAGRSYADGVAYGVSAISSTTITTSATPNGIAAGDEVMIINVRGDNTNYFNAGNYENFYVTTVDTVNKIITIRGSISKIYGATTSNGTLTNQNIIVQRVPNYGNVTVNNGITLTANTWGGTTGGLLAFRASGTLTNAGTISVNGLGYRGGAGQYGDAVTTVGGYGGEALCGLGGTGSGSTGAAGGGGWSAAGAAGLCGGGGGGGGNCSNCAGGTGASVKVSSGGGSGGGGGANTASGGAGGYGTAGTGGVSQGNTGATGGTNASGNGGQSAGTTASGGGGGGTYGINTLTKLFMGAAGGGGGTGGGGGGTSAGGGYGGGIIYIAANTITNTGGIQSNGTQGTACSGTVYGGSGGGAGGSIYLYVGSSSTLGSNVITATGGAGRTCTAAGGTGGVGRIAIYGTVSSGTTNPTHTSTTSVDPNAVTLVSGQNENINESAISQARYGSTCRDGGDAVNYSVTALGTNTATLSTTPTTGCLVNGDEVLLINLQGTTSNFTNTGNYETFTVSSVSTNTVTFTSNLTKYYGNGASDQTNLGTATTNQRVILQRIPTFTNVTVNSGASLTANAWNGVKGGVLAFRVTGTLTNAGTISVNGLGYRGGAGQYGDAVTIVGGYGGEALCGLGGTGSGSTGAGGGGGWSAAGAAGLCGGGGGGGGNCSNCAGGTGSAGSGGSGGGGGANTASGGAGGYGTAGTGGAGGNTGASGGTNASGNGGQSAGTTASGGGGGGTYGATTLTKLFLGSAGGSGGTGGGGGGTSAGGGYGGGVIFITAGTITNTGGIQSNGTQGTACSGTVYGGSGGGAGGSVYLSATGTVTLGSSIVTATGGAGRTCTAAGGTGGAGRIAVHNGSGTTNPTFTSF